MNDDFYIGYLPKAPAALARFTRCAVLVAAGLALAGGVALAVALPYFGAGEFEFGTVREFKGALRCAAAPRLAAAEAVYLLGGGGKRGLPPEICGASGNEVALRGTLIRRDGRQLIEIADAPQTLRPAGPEPETVALGRFTLTGEVVDSKCYFGVMNPAEGRAHRACAVQCLRGGVPACRRYSSPAIAPARRRTYSSRDRKAKPSTKRCCRGLAKPSRQAARSCARASGSSEESNRPR